MRASVGYGEPTKDNPDLKPWVSDVLRHTAISHYFRATGSYGRTAEQFGNSESDHQEALPEPGKQQGYETVLCAEAVAGEAGKTAWWHAAAGGEDRAARGERGCSARAGGGVRAPLWVEGDGTRVGGRRPLMRRWAAQIDLRAI